MVGRLSSRGRLKIERDWTREADRDSAPFNGKGNSELVYVCGFQRQFSEPESSLPLFEQRYQRLNVSHLSDPHPVDRRFHLSRYTCGVGATDNLCRKIPSQMLFLSSWPVAVCDLGQQALWQATTHHLKSVDRSKANLFFGERVLDVFFFGMNPAHFLKTHVVNIELQLEQSNFTTDFLCILVPRATQTALHNTVMIIVLGVQLSEHSECLGRDIRCHSGTMCISWKYKATSPIEQDGSLEWEKHFRDFNSCLGINNATAWWALWRFDRDGWRSNNTAKRLAFSAKMSRLKTEGN